MHTDSQSDIERNETRALLYNDGNGPDPVGADACIQTRIHLQGATPLPWVQLSMLCFMRLLDPLAFTQIFPYINQFVADLGVADRPARVGFYSGLVESAFALFQLLSIYPWGYLSDALGRRPVVLVGVAGLCIATMLFGVSHTFTEVLLARAAAGLFSGNVAVIPSMLCEITDKSNQSFAFPFFGLWWPVGAIIGPMIGGLFVKPAEKYPRYFDYALLRKYPYLLPCLLVSMVSSVGFICAVFLLKETRGLEPQCDCPSRQTASYGTTKQQKTAADMGTQGRLNMRELASIPIIRALCASACMLSFISTAFDVLFVLFCFSSVESGGLAFSTAQTGYALATSGLLAAVLQVVFMPTLLKRVDHTVLYHFCIKLWPYTFLALPFLNIIARQGVARGPLPGQSDAYLVGTLWAGIAMVLAMARVAFLPYSINMLLVKCFAPDPAALGSIMGLVQFSICFSRSFSPFVASWIYTHSTEHTFLGGFSWTLILAGVSFGGCVFSSRIVKEAQKMF